MENQKRPRLPIFEPEDLYGPKAAPIESDDQVKIKNLREEQRLIVSDGGARAKKDAADRARLVERL